MTNLSVFKSSLNVFKYKPWQIIKQDITSSFRPLKYNVMSQAPAWTEAFIRSWINQWEKVHFQADILDPNLRYIHRSKNDVNFSLYLSHILPMSACYMQNFLSHAINQNFVYTSHYPYICLMFYPSHTSWFNCLNMIRWRESSGSTA